MRKIELRKAEIEIQREMHVILRTEDGAKSERFAALRQQLDEIQIELYITTREKK